MPETLPWALLIYKLPPHPTRLRIQVWRKLQALGSIYLQDGVAVLPSRDDLEENLEYIATSVREMEGSAVLLKAVGFSKGDATQIVARFQAAAADRMREVLGRVVELAETTNDAGSAEDIVRLEEAIKRERIAYLKARRLSYFGSDVEPRVEEAFAKLRTQIEILGGSK